MKIIAIQDCKEIKSAEADIDVDLGTDKIYVSKFPSFVYKNGKTDIIPITDLYGSDLETNTKNGKIVANWKLVNIDRKINIWSKYSSKNESCFIKNKTKDPEELKLLWILFF